MPRTAPSYFLGFAFGFFAGAFASFLPAAAFVKTASGTAGAPEGAAEPAGRKTAGPDVLNMPVIGQEDSSKSWSSSQRRHKCCSTRMHAPRCVWAAQLKEILL